MAISKSREFCSHCAALPGTKKTAMDDSGIVFVAAAIGQSVLISQLPR
jgi:hypothetical protein